MSGALSGNLMTKYYLTLQSRAQYSLNYMNKKRAWKIAANSLSTAQPASVGPGTTVHRSAQTHVRDVSQGIPSALTR